MVLSSADSGNALSWLMILSILSHILAFCTRPCASFLSAVLPTLAVVKGVKDTKFPEVQETYDKGSPAMLTFCIIMFAKISLLVYIMVLE